MHRTIGQHHHSTTALSRGTVAVESRREQLPVIVIAIVIVIVSYICSGHASFTQLGGATAGTLGQCVQLPSPEFTQQKVVTQL